MSTQDSDTPPSFQPIHTVELVSVKDSKITNVSVYSGRAEITRLFKFDVKTGQNQVVIIGLPSVLDQESLRVEGHGSATIHDVTISNIPAPTVKSTSPDIEALLSKRKRTEKALERCQKSLKSLETFLGTLDAQHVSVTDLGKIVENYDKAGEGLDDKVSALEEELRELDEQIEKEREKLSGPIENEKLGLKVSIGVFANAEGEVEIALIYAVSDATWHAGYDIRVDMQTKDKPVSVIYKAAITQSTGEDWDDIPLTLETAAPTFGVGIPDLLPWTLSIYKPPLYKYTYRRSLRAPSGGGVFAGATPRLSAPLAQQSLALDTDAEDSLQHRELAVMSKGNVNATFGVPGMITIPSDGVAHNVTIVKLVLEAEMSWVCVPKKDAKTHLNAKIKNASEYTLLDGNASVYVDGSFISRSTVPLVSPEESFDCPLGLDPSIRITYHPIVKKVSQTGFYNKTSNHVFSQRITIFNTKSTPIEKFKVVDQVPIAEDSLINVKLLSPSLPPPLLEGTKNSNNGSNVASQVKLTNDVVAQWDGADEPGFDVEALGKNGKFNWLCTIPAQEKLNLLLQWEVTAPGRTNIVGM